ncbi:bifunctional pyr operon transcriptional regulator/uracil phosphoribosyltransferase PyrR [Candidatus Sumerlaeota bacterium]|nr:bifunctional pyr operon transcriptional regulator/uracil phosphoribosyltransferase PyrR [Candidatus Sumerlaeales bacterium]NLD61377.1 bifunctional pyr operon transcriptional regulator/uracil phosphoribosyltransferase PyrR [Candidatus Sumerlaeota bacterium]
MAHDFPVLRTLMTENDLDRSLMLLAAQLYCDFPNDPDLILVGIKTRGVYIAQKLAELLKKNHGMTTNLGELDITLYRDDLSTLGAQPMVTGSNLSFDVSDKKLVIVDDVLFTGRTIRAAMDHVVDYGRPKLMRLLVVIDRGMREYPIQADYIGMKLATDKTQVIQVRIKEADEGHQDVLLCRLPDKC